MGKENEQRSLKEALMRVARLHGKPKTRRDFFSSGLMPGIAYVATPTVLSMLATKDAQAQTQCPQNEAGGIPFLAIELRGGPNLAGSNVMVGGAGGQTDAIANSGYRSLGLTANINSADEALGLKFHTGSQLLAGIKETTTAEIQSATDGVLFCHRSVDDIGTSRLNPTYAVQLAGARGSLTDLVGNTAAESGGRMPTPQQFYNPAIRPTRITKPADAISLVNLGALADQLGTDAIRRILKATEQMSSTQIQRFSALDLPDQVKVLAECGYIKPQENVLKFTKEAVDASTDTGISGTFNLNNGNEQSLGTMVKLLKDGYAGAGTFVVGGNDYHDGSRATGDAIDLRNGRFIGRALTAFAAAGKPAVIYVFADGGVSSSNGTAWTGDSGTRGASFMLVYNPAGRVSLRAESARQIGYFNDTGAVDSGGSLINASDENVVMAVAANYLALQGKEGELRQRLRQDPFGRNGLEKVLAFAELPK